MVHGGSFPVSIKKDAALRAPLKWLRHFKGKGFAALCASEPPEAVPATLAPRKVFFPTYTPPEKTISLYSRLRARTPAEGFLMVWAGL